MEYFAATFLALIAISQFSKVTTNHITTSSVPLVHLLYDLPPRLRWHVMTIFQQSLWQWRNWGVRLKHLFPMTAPATAGSPALTSGFSNIRATFADLSGCRVTLPHRPSSSLCHPNLICHGQFVTIASRPPLRSYHPS